MLEIKTSSKKINIDDYSITYNYDGYDVLEFDVSVDDPIYSDIKECVFIRESSVGTFMITKIEGNSRYVHVTAELDLTDYQGDFYENFENDSETLEEVITSYHTINGVEYPPILQDWGGNDWTFVNRASATKKRTLRLEHGTALDLLNNISALYNVVFRFDTKNDVLTAIDPDGEDYQLGAAFVTEELNLRSLQYYGDASNYANRLEVRGKDGLTFEGLEIDGQTIQTSYVEDLTYYSWPVYGFWQDERYTDKRELYEAALRKLREYSQPRQSYECDVIDLKAIDPEKYSAFDLSLFQRVSLKDTKRNTETTYQVVKYKVYPHYPEKNVVTLSTNPPSISQKLIDIEETAVEASEAAVEASKEAKNATSWMTDSANGRIYFVRDNDGNITSMVLKVIDADNPSAAPVWVFNSNGIGYSATGISGTPIVSMTADGAVRAIKSFTLVDGNNLRRGKLEYNSQSGVSLFLVNANNEKAAQLYQNDSGGGIALYNNNNKVVLTGSVGEDQDGVLNVFNSDGQYTINLSGQSGRVTCVSLTQTSSRKIKCNIEPIQDAEKILELEAVSFDYKNSSLGTNKRGFIAEDVAEILPNLVIPETDEAPTRLDYIGMIPYLQAMIKEQQAQIEELQEAVEGLRKVAMV